MPPRKRRSSGDPLILVDENDRIVGYRDKESCHDGVGVLHRAFSILIFNPEGEILLQKRSREKRLWPLRWSNSCCSHPRRGETMIAAARRRLREELGMTARLKAIGKLRYRFRFGGRGSENELTTVFAGTSSARVSPDPGEVADWRWCSVARLERDLASHPRRFTPWFRLEWEAFSAGLRAAVKGR